VLQPSPTGQQTNGGACTRCKSQKVKCEYSNGSQKCQRCLKTGLECIPAVQNPSQARSLSQEPSQKSSVPELAATHLRALREQPGPSKRPCQPEIQKTSTKPPRSQSQKTAGESSHGKQPAHLSIPQDMAYIYTHSTAQHLPAIAEDNQEAELSDNIPSQTIDSFAQFVSACSIELDPVCDELSDSADDDEESSVMESDGDSDKSGRYTKITGKGKGKETVVQPARKKPGPKPKPKPKPVLVEEPVEEAYDPTTCRMCHICPFI
jgi:hypothetical protein